MLKNLLGTFIGAKVEQRAGHPLAGAVVGTAAVALARRSLPLAIGLALGAVAVDYLNKRRARGTVPAFNR
jgi:hypothetical protein